MKKLLPLRRVGRSSSWGRNRVFFAIFAVVLAFSAPRGLSSTASQLPTVSFFQLNVVFDGDRHPHSQWGAVDLKFVGSAQLLYFNLTVLSGNSRSPVWRIQNLPVISREGPTVRQKITFNFNLANTRGRRSIPSTMRSS